MKSSRFFLILVFVLSLLLSLSACGKTEKTKTFIGFHTEIAPDVGYQKCPEFWDKEYNEKICTPLADNET